MSVARRSSRAVSFLDLLARRGRRSLSIRSRIPGPVRYVIPFGREPGKPRIHISPLLPLSAETKTGPKSDCAESAANNASSSNIPLELSLCQQRVNDKQRSSRYLTRQVVLAGYVRSLDTADDMALLQVFNDKVLSYLRKKGHTVEDVVSWAWVLTAPRAVQAAGRCRALSQQPGSRLPFFIFHSILRRPDLDARALRVLLVSAHEVLEHMSRQSLNHRNVMGLFERLIHAACREWPGALTAIASIFTSVFGVASGKPSAQQARRLGLLYNTCLALLAQKCTLHPFLSVRSQQLAQFQLLREMSDFDPPILVTRRGYQAITQVQVSHKKTVAEGEWAAYQSKSWPPWKELKLGIDSERWDEGSKSRAIKAIAHMTDAGYAHTGWEQVASILAGWDVDGTPTIQTRALLQPPSRAVDEVDVWVARIRATRTLKEAWACFLSLQEQGLPSSKEAYFAMAEKIVFHGRMTAEPRHHYSPAMPGDRKEVSPEPFSPRDVIYVHTDPPSLNGLLDMMYSQGLKPSGKFLSFLLAHMSNIHDGLHCLWSSNLPEDVKLALVLQLPHKDLQEPLCHVSDHIFAAFIKLLCNVAIAPGGASTVPELFPIVFSPDSRDLSVFSYSRKPEPPLALIHAVRLTKARRPRYRPAWYNLLATITQDKPRERLLHIPISAQRVVSWWETMEILEWLQEEDLAMDAVGVEMVSSALCRLIGAARANMGGAERGLRMAQQARARRGGSIQYGSVSQMIDDSLAKTKQLFNMLMHPRAAAFGASPVASDTTDAIDALPQSDFGGLPPFHDTPSPFLLHSLVRALGLAHDMPALLQLLVWMRRFEPELAAAVDERAGGWTQLRRAVVATRVFVEERESDPLPALEKPVSVGDGGNGGGLVAEREADVCRAKEIVEATEMLAPWATDEELLEYLDR